MTTDIKQETSAPTAASRSGSSVLLNLYDRVGMALVLVLLVVLMAFIAPNFLTLGNFFNVTRQVSINAILAAGATFVILTAGIDLSVGSALGVTGVAAVWLSVHGWPPVAAMVAALALGALVGLVNGVLVARWKLAPFIVTLAALTYLRGLAYVFTDGRPLNAPDLGWAILGQGAIANIPFPVLVMVGVYVVSWFLLHRTVFGRQVYSVGGNVEAARLSGVPVRKVLIWVYVIAGLCAAIAGLIFSARLQSGQPTGGDGYELNAIAAVVLGGTSLMGGRGTIIGTLIGAMIIGVLGNGLILMNVPFFYQLVIQGVVIVIAVGIDRLRQRRERVA
jgi:ribose transport system permease protein